MIFRSIFRFLFREHFFPQPSKWMPNNRTSWLPREEKKRNFGNFRKLLWNRYFWAGEKLSKPSEGESKKLSGQIIHTYKKQINAVSCKWILFCGIKLAYFFNHPFSNYIDAISEDKVTLNSETLSQYLPGLEFPRVTWEEKGRKKPNTIERKSSKGKLVVNIPKLIFLPVFRSQSYCTTDVLSTAFDQKGKIGRSKCAFWKGFSRWRWK